MAVYDKDTIDDALADVGLDRDTFIQMAQYVGLTATELASQQYGLALALLTDALARVFASHSHGQGWTDAQAEENLDEVRKTLGANTATLREWLKSRNQKPN